MQPPEQSEVFRFGDYLLDAQRRHLTRDGKLVELGSRSFDLLVLLVRAAGKVASKKEIMDEVWPNITVDEANLRFQVSRLRRELAKSPHPGEYIQSVAGRGYVFVAPIEVQAAQHIAERRSDLETGTRRSMRVRLLFGREEDLKKLQDLLLDVRFVSIVGSAGLGKTTAALELGHRFAGHFRQSVCFVDLGLVNSSDAVLQSIATAVGFSFVSGDLLRGLVSFLNERQVLLILDCCEHVLDAVSEITATLFRENPSAFILTTSREPLRALGENVYNLPPLVLPEAMQGKINACWFPPRTEPVRRIISIEN